MDDIWPSPPAPRGMQYDSSTALPLTSDALAPLPAVSCEPRGHHVVVIMPRCSHDHVRISHKIAWSLRQTGYEVTLVAADAHESSYLDMRVVKATAPFGSMLRPLLNFPAQLRQALALRADLYLAYNPDTLLVGLALAMLGRRVVYDTAEDFLLRPFIHPTVPRSLAPIVARSLEAGERLLARWAVATSVTQPQMLARRRGCMLLENAPLTQGPIIDAALRSSPAIRRPDADICLVYAGIITPLRGLERMLEILVRLNRQQHARLVLVGKFFPADLAGVAARHPGWRYVDYQGYVPHHEALAWIRCADLGLALLDPVADHPTSSITKLYEYMQCGTPFVASDFAGWRRSIDDIDAGLFVEPDDLDGITVRIAELAKDSQRLDAMRRAGEHYIEEKFNWQRISRPFVVLIDSVLGSSRT